MSAMHLADLPRYTGGRLHGHPKSLQEFTNDSFFGGACLAVKPGPHGRRIAWLHKVLKDFGLGVAAWSHAPSSDARSP